MSRREKRPTQMRPETPEAAHPVTSGCHCSEVVRRNCVAMWVRLLGASLCNRAWVAQTMNVVADRLEDGPAQQHLRRAASAVLAMAANDYVASLLEQVVRELQEGEHE